VLFPFKLRIESATPDAKGKVEVAEFFTERPLPDVIDGNPDNNVAYVVLNGTAPPSPSAPASPSPSGDHNGGLPVTGTPVIVIAAAGLVLAAMGFVLLRIARRRRLTEV
jgi:LPXTG-motif cell wall-anchored protein